MEYMESKMQDCIEAGVSEADRCYTRIAELEDQNAALGVELSVLKSKFEEVSSAAITVSNICHRLAYNSRNTENILDQLDVLQNKILCFRNASNMRYEDMITEVKVSTLVSAIRKCNKYEAFPVKRGAIADLVVSVEDLEQYADSIRQGGE